MRDFATEAVFSDWLLEQGFNDTYGREFRRGPFQYWALSAKTQRGVTVTVNVKWSAVENGPLHATVWVGLASHSRMQWGPYYEDGWPEVTNLVELALLEMRQLKLTR